MRVFQVKNFQSGLITELEDYSIPEDAASNSLNWLTKGDKIELTGGYQLVDADNENTGSGKVTGLHVAEKVDGSVQAFYSYGQKVKYLDSSGAWQEISTDLLGTDADGEDVSFDGYVSSAGYQTWLSSPNSSLYKIMTANPETAVDQYDASKNFKGYINIQNGRTHLWYRDKFRNYFYGSWIDAQDSSVYTTVSSEAIGGSGSTNYTGTLVFKSGGAKRTCFNVVFTDGTQTAQDDKNGNFVGDATGTINYATGVYDITFNSTTTGSVTADYEWEDSTANGIADFSFSATRAALEGFFLPQNTGGDILNILPYRTEFYCIHENNAWLYSMPVNDTNPTNQIFRAKVGMQNWRAAVATGDGIYYIDTSEKSQPRFKLLTLEANSDQVIPVSFSFNLDLSGYDFSSGIATEFDDYIIFSGTDSNGNQRTFLYNKIWKSFDVTNYSVSCFANNNGVLWAGDALSNNVLKLFNTFSQGDAIIENYWEGKLSKLGVEELKKYKRLTIEGDISPDQNIEVYLAYDRGGYVKLGDISGDGSYVDAGSSIVIGSVQVGKNELGGGGDGVEAFHYRREFRVRSDRFDEVKIKFVATKVGYASISTINYYDIKLYGQKNIQRYRTTS